MTTLAQISGYVPKFSGYLKGENVDKCLHKMAKKKKGKDLVKFFDKAIHCKEWKTDNGFKSLLSQAAKTGPKLKISSKNKSKLKKLIHNFEKKASKVAKSAPADTTIFAPLEQELTRVDTNSLALQATLKEALKQNIALTLATLKKANATHLAIKTVCATFKEIAQNKTLPSLSQIDTELIANIASCYEAIQGQMAETQTLSPQETLQIALLSQNELPKIEVVRKRVLKGGKNWIKKEDFSPNLSHDLLINQKKKKIYAITKKELGEGAHKKVVAAVGFTFEHGHFKKPKLVAYSATESMRGVKKELKNEVKIAKKVKNISTILKAQYAKVDKTKKGRKMRMITDLCDGDLDYILEKKANSLTKRDVVQLTKECVHAIFSLHEKGISHGDVKPGNFLVKAKHAKLADFGGSFPLDKGNPDFLQAYGTHIYNSPETLTIQNQAAHTAAQDDVFALGLTLWELLTKKALNEKWDDEIDKFVEIYESGQLAKGPNSEESAENLAKIENTIKTSVAKTMQAAIESPNHTAEDTAIIACMQVASKMLKPANERVDISRAMQEINEIQV